MKNLMIFLRVAAVAACVVSCYAPKLEDGALLCSGHGECPAGYVCVAKACYKHGLTPGGGADGAVGRMDGGLVTSDGGGDGAVGRMDGGLAACFGPIAACAPENKGKCDPVCQSGCKCSERCLYEGAAATCREARAPFTPPGDACSSSMDTCRPGSACIDEATPACGAHCYRYCRVDADCGDKARCIGYIRDPVTDVTLYNICSPQIEPTCIPAGRADCPGTGRSLPTFGCYILSATHPDQSVCDCAGSKKLGELCDNEHECVPGTECVRLGDMKPSCRKVCALGVVVGLASCPATMTCKAFAGAMGASTRYGYCL